MRVVGEPHLPSPSPSRRLRRSAPTKFLYVRKGAVTADRTASGAFSAEAVAAATAAMERKRADAAANPDHSDGEDEPGAEASGDEAPAAQRRRTTEVPEPLAEGSFDEAPVTVGAVVPVALVSPDSAPT